MLLTTDFTPFFGEFGEKGQKVLRMVVTVQTYSLLLGQKITPPYWKVPLTRSKFGLMILFLGHFTLPFDNGVNAWKMSQLHWAHYKFTPCQWDFPIRRGKFLYHEQGVSLHCQYHSWDSLPLFPKLSKKWSKVSSEQHFKILDICGLSAFFAAGAAGVTLGSF